MGSFAITHVDVFDGSTLSRDQAVAVTDGTITGIGLDLELEPGLPTIEGADCTLLPGLIDSHVHVEGEVSLRQSLVFGVTTVLDMFCDYREARELRNLAGDPDRQVADLLTAGTLVTAPNGHGTEYGLTIPTISGPEDAESFVDARISEGSQFIKIVYDDGSAYGRPFPTIDEATMYAVIGAAHKRGKLAVVHALSLRFAMDALRCGADGLVHLFIDTPPTSEFNHLLRKSNAFVIPTLTVLESVCGTSGGAALLAESDFARHLPGLSVANLKAPFPTRRGAFPSYEVPRSTVPSLIDDGVPVLAGTDAPNPGTTYGASIHRELELLVDAGMTQTDALASATSIPAKTFRLDDRGRLGPGARADMLMVRGDPTKDIKATRKIVAVWRLGRSVDRDSFRKTE
ncbi:MAG: amidohydrolase family protein [Thaumarchaeota archaeon]|nr:amidohydrolase family protein [Nitrososphaerota archaeon]